MRIAYMDPLIQSWNRTKKALFHPFDLGKWFVVGFTAFLAGLTGGGIPGGWPSSHRHRDIGLPDASQLDLNELLLKAWEWLMMHPIWFALIVAGVILGTALIVFLTWISSRGAFMFLDNVVQDRAQVVAPWRRFRVQGNSLFAWRVGFGLVCFLLMIPLLILGFLSFVPILKGQASLPQVFQMAAVVCLGLLVTIVIAYISLFNASFVVPLMYKHNIRALAAWQKFLPLLANYLPHFVLFGLFLIPLFLGVAIVVIIGGCATCCIGFLLLMLPYIGAVVTLPISYTFRAFSLDFLSQWGPEVTLFPSQMPVTEEVPPIPPSMNSTQP